MTGDMMNKRESIVVTERRTIVDLILVKTISTIEEEPDKGQGMNKGQGMRQPASSNLNVVFCIVACTRSS